VIEHNALKYAVDITRGLKRIFGVDDGEQGVTRLSESLQISSDPLTTPEMQFPIGINRWAVAPTSGASIGNVSQVGIRNPAKSGYIVVVDAMVLFLSANSVMNVRVSNAGTVFGGTGTPTQTDLRIPNFPNPSLATVSFTNAAAAAIGTLLWTFQLSANSLPIVPFPVILLPGFDLLVDNNLANTAITCNFVGREWRGNPGELLTS
jgi:hypothetical protein